MARRLAQNIFAPEFMRNGARRMSRYGEFC
jgi:hypothetical protein